MLSSHLYPSAHLPVYSGKHSVDYSSVEIEVYWGPVITLRYLFTYIYIQTSVPNRGQMLDMLYLDSPYQLVPLSSMTQSMVSHCFKHFGVKTSNFRIVLQKNVYPIIIWEADTQLFCLGVCIKLSLFYYHV